MWLLIGVVGAFAGIAIVNTSVMAMADRRAELALVRLIGATRRQAARMIAAEATVTALVGAGAGALAARLAVARIADGRPGWHIVVPPSPFGGIVAGAAALALLGSLPPTDRSSRRPRRQSIAIELAELSISTDWNWGEGAARLAGEVG
ncbi:MAG: hypothetical protein JO039_08225 [Solirubrobacterales bacterium]|nr:hypothetical protein [Solirubrobacterales bacterium]